MLRSWN